MSSWNLEIRGTQAVLSHSCEAARPSDGNDLLCQDIGGGYVRCSRCGEKYLPEQMPGNPRLLLVLETAQASCPPPMHG